MPPFLVLALLSYTSTTFNFIAMYISSAHALCAPGVLDHHSSRSSSLCQEQRLSCKRGAENTELATRAGSTWANGCAFLTCVMSPSSIPNLEITDLLVVPVGFKVQFKAHMPIFPFWNDHGGLWGPLSLHLKLVTWYSHRSACSKQWPC